MTGIQIARKMDEVLTELSELGYERQFVQGLADDGKALPEDVDDVYYAILDKKAELDGLFQAASSLVSQVIS